MLNISADLAIRQHLGVHFSKSIVGQLPGEIARRIAQDGARQQGTDKTEQEKHRYNGD